MENRIGFPEDILNQNIPGFHRYDLTGPIRPDYVSKNLCDMLDCSAEELLVEEDGYALRVHPDDREAYLAFLSRMAREESQGALKYRLIHKSGREICVLDSFVSKKTEGGMQGFSTLALAAGVPSFGEGNGQLSPDLPCGVLKFSCEANPRVTYMNDQMRRMFRIPPEDAQQLQQCCQNIYLMIPPENRSAFQRFLSRVYAEDHPFSGETTALRCDGSAIRLYGWISKSINDAGQEEFLGVCMDMTEHHERQHRREEQRYLRALSQVYDEICEINPAKHSIQFLQGRFCKKLGAMAHMSMHLEDTVRYWVENIVIEEDRRHVCEVFKSVAASRDMDSIPLQMEFRVRYSDGSIGTYIGVFLDKRGNWLFCARNVTHQTDVDTLKRENDMLRNRSDQMSELVMRFTDGMIAFEINGDSVRPMYISDNIQRYFGYDENQWLKTMQTYTPIREFVSRCHISYEDFLDLLENHESEFNYTDFASGTTRRMRAICTSEDSEGRYYIVLHQASDAARKAENLPDVRIRTFGYFDVFINGVPIAFRYEKAKELLAILTDRRGGFVTSAEAISLLWENEEANAVTLARYRKVALRLKNTLEEYGISSIIESVDGKRRIIPQRVHCDLFEYFDGNAQLFKGSYLQNYSWGETTLAELML